jgi:hypothetical protein
MQLAELWRSALRGVRFRSLHPRLSPKVSEFFT